MEEEEKKNRVKEPISQPSYEVEVRDIRIPMRHGVQLYAKRWFPESEELYPVIINYDPYRSLRKLFSFFFGFVLVGTKKFGERFLDHEQVRFF